MSYTSRHSMGALTAATYPANTQLVAGYRIVGLTRPAGEVPALLREAMQAAFRGATLRTGWGGGAGSAGVPSGHVYAVVETRAGGVTSDTMSGIFSRVASDLQSRLGGGTVTNTHAHLVSGGGTPSGGGAPGFDPSSLLSVVPSVGPGVAPGPLPEDYLPPPPPIEEPFLTRTVGGIPMWGLLAGGTVAVGALAYMMMSGRSSSAVKANRRRG
jgi:hypothetical protein